MVCCKIKIWKTGLKLAFLLKLFERKIMSFVTYFSNLTLCGLLRIKVAYNPLGMFNRDEDFSNLQCVQAFVRTLCRQRSTWCQFLHSTLNFTMAEANLINNYISLPSSREYFRECTGELIVAKLSSVCHFVRNPSNPVMDWAHLKHCPVCAWNLKCWWSENVFWEC